MQSVEDQMIATRRRELSRYGFVVLGFLTLAIAGCVLIAPTLQLLWVLWTTDALKSVGMIVPVVSFLIVLRVWRGLGWTLEGSWWGFAILALLSIFLIVRRQSVMELILTPQWTIYLPPHSLVVFAYGFGVTLLIGGMRLVRACRFPLLLLFAVNPVPHVFNVYVDLPLQRASAHVARAFASGLGQPLSPDKLRLMFTPDFGMFIAPGCNGIRGAVTMGLIALVAGYLYRFRWRSWILLVLSAVALGYVFNFVRLCTLVLFYLVALKFPSLQGSAENADYLIGATLFFAAVYLLYTIVLRAGNKALPATVLPTVPSLRQEQSARLRLAAFAGLIALSSFSLVHAMHAEEASLRRQPSQLEPGPFPDHVGDFSLVRRWNETLIGGALLFHWAEYAPRGGGAHVNVGISPVLGAHDTLVCHSARGEDPLWHGPEAFRGPSGSTTPFSVSLFNDGATQYLEATTLCNGETCGEDAELGTRFALVYSRPQIRNILQNYRPIPILLKTETVDTTLPKTEARVELTKSIADFLKAADLAALTRPYRSQ